MDKLLTIGWVDLTKIGVLTQKDMNKVGTWCERLISRNPTSHSRQNYVFHDWLGSLP